MNEAENSFVYSSLPSNASAWIGFNDDLVEGSFVWESGCTSSYTNWRSGQPDNWPSSTFDQNYGNMIRANNGTWDDSSAFATSGCVCQLSTQCPVGWILFGDTCYFADTQPSTYTDCRNQCSAMSSDMLCVLDSTQDTFLKFLMYAQGNNLWIGYNDESLEGNFTWEGTCPSSYTNWEANNPNGGTNESYVSKGIGAAGQWVDFPNALPGFPSMCGCETPKSETSFLESCPDGWTLFNHQCYFVDTTSSSYTECRSQCSSLSSEMLCIEDSTQDLFVSGLMTNINKGIWIGYSEEAVEGSYKWEGSCRSNYTNWASGQPNNFDGGLQDYAAKRPPENGGWNDFVLDGLSATHCACQTSVHATHCPTRWSYFAGKCYYTGFVTSYNSCKSQCSRMGSDMLCVEDAAEDDFLTTAMNDVGYSMWIGYNDTRVEGTFEWEGTCSSNYTNWSPSQPNNNFGLQHYGGKRLEDAGEWHDFELDGENKVVCACELEELETTEVVCPTGWLLFNENCYFVATVISNYTECKNQCSSLNSDMLCVENSAQDSFLSAVMYGVGYSIWIGLNDISLEGTFEWEGSCSSSYTNWGTGQPDNSLSGEHYVGKFFTFDGIYYDGLWSDFPLEGGGVTVCACQTAVLTVSPSVAPTSAPR